MSNMVELYEQSPDNLKVLNAFVLVGREKLVSVRVETRAIHKLESAEKLRQRKMEEAKMLCEALLDAELSSGDYLFWGLAGFTKISLAIQHWR